MLPYNFTNRSLFDVTHVLVEWVIWYSRPTLNHVLIPRLILLGRVVVVVHVKLHQFDVINTTLNAVQVVNEQFIPI